MLRQHEPESPPTAVADPVGERLLRARTIIISGEITQKLAATVSGQLLALAAESEADITVFINSQGATSRRATRFTISSASSGRMCG